MSPMFLSKKLTRKFRFGRSRPGSNPLPWRRWRPLLEQLEDRTLLASTLSQLFVGQAYRDLLGRQADSSGLAAWSEATDQGVLSPVQVALAIGSSPEYRTK